MYENGQREPDFETLEALADYFNVDMRTFFPGGESSVLVHSPAREILDMLSDMTPEELALVKSRIQKIKESR
jgi:transcriptional regulator with XRE-family HTH domain